MLTTTAPDLEQARQRFRTFCEGGGKFRVAIVNRCNLDCFFCHNEAMPNPRLGQAWERRLDDDALLGLIDAYIRLGGPTVNITGGEPLTHPDPVGFLRRIDRRGARISLNTNALAVRPLLDAAERAPVDAILASLHTMDEAVFRAALKGRALSRVMDNIVALKSRGYPVCLNFSLGAYNQAAFPRVLDFALTHGLALKAIAFVRADERPDFYRGDWIDPAWLGEHLRRRGAVAGEPRLHFGGVTTPYRLEGVQIEIKNVAAGRLVTDYCRGCPHLDRCGEGIYGLRVGVDGLFKPCLLGRSRFVPVQPDIAYEQQLLRIVAAMVGRFDHARYTTGVPR